MAPGSHRRLRYGSELGSDDSTMAGSDLEVCRARSSHTKRANFFEDRRLRIGRRLNAIEELVGPRYCREKDRAYACARKATDNLLENHRRFIEAESLAKRLLGLAKTQHPGRLRQPALTYPITQGHYDPAEKENC